MAKNSIERSHSKWSNFKLSLLSLVASIAFSGIWFVLIFKESFSNENQFYLVLAVNAVLIILSILLFSRFKR